METYEIVAVVATLIGVALSIGKYQHQNQK
jgi:hypothetical protein